MRIGIRTISIENNHIDTFIEQTYLLKCSNNIYLSQLILFGSTIIILDYYHILNTINYRTSFILNFNY